MKYLGILPIGFLALWGMAPSPQIQAANQSRDDWLCVEWQHASHHDRAVAGPKMAERCMDYLANRSEQDTMIDEAIWRTRLGRD